MRKSEIKIFKDSYEIANYIRNILSKTEASRDSHLALSGGNTPKLIYSYLAEPSSTSIPWTNIKFYWGDERCVPPTHPESNYLMAKTTLLDKIETIDENVFRIKGEENPHTENERYSQLIFTKNQGIFDFILLGLGSDGHTASIFPDQMDLLTSHRICEVAKHPESGQSRITLTGNTINHAKNILFLVTGTGKSVVVGDIIAQKNQWEQYPASHIHPDSGNLIWLLDEKAAVGL